MKIARWLVKTLQRNASRKLVSTTHKPDKSQREFLLCILKANQQTEIGKKYNFQSIKSISEYKSKVPITSADQYQALIEQEYEGKSNVLSHQPPHFYAMTAGSTGAYKYIPLTKDLKRDLDQAVLAYNHIVEKACPELSKGRIQFIVGSANGGHSPGGTPQGFVSGYNYKNLPNVIRSRFIIPYEIFEIEDPDDRYYAMARFLAGVEDLRAVCAISPVNIIRIIESALKNIHILITDLTNGTLSINSGIDRSNKSVIQPPTNKRLAQVLAEQLKTLATPQTIAKSLFPDLRYCLCWMGGNMHYYIPELKNYLPNISIFEMPFSASEGIFALPLKSNETGGLLALRSAFFEFIEEDNIELVQPPTLLAHEIELNKHYYLVISTRGGLYRYSIEDLIRVKDFFNNTPIIEFISKKSRQVSIANERLNENQVTEAMLASCKEANITKPNFIFFPCTDKRYRVVVDNLKTNSKDFCQVLEKWMQHYSKGYQFEREDKLLLPIEIVISGKEQFSLFFDRQNNGRNLPNAQVKPLHLSNAFDGYQPFME